MLYINGIVPNVKNVNVNLFADDTLLCVACDTIEETVDKMNEDLSSIYSWLCSNKLSLNIEKTKAMIITLKKNVDRDVKVHINK
jgi:hypothetical protein